MILAIDQGTTGTTCLVFDEEAELIGRGYREFEQHFPKPGWVEHDAAEIWTVTQAVAGEALEDAGVAGDELDAIGITNQRETVCRLGSGDGRAAAPRAGLAGPPHRQALRRAAGRRATRRCSASAPAWSSTRTSPARRSSGCSRTSTGSATRRPSGKAVFGTIDAWLIFNLTGEHATDQSNASRTLLCDIPRPRGTPSCSGCSETSRSRRCRRSGPAAASSVTRKPDLFGGAKVPVAGVAGDQQAALFGQACIEPGLGKNTYGTGSFVLLNTGGKPTEPHPRACCPPSRGGSASARRTRWKPRSSSPAPPSSGCATACRSSSAPTRPSSSPRSLDSNDGVYFVPALTGLGSPHWDPYARGTVVGLTRGSGRAHLARAALEAMAYQAVDAVRAMRPPCPASR